MQTSASQTVREHCEFGLLALSSFSLFLAMLVDYFTTSPRAWTVLLDLHLPDVLRGERRNHSLPAPEISRGFNTIEMTKQDLIPPHDFRFQRNLAYCDRSNVTAVWESRTKLRILAGTSLCETCRHGRQVRTARSCFLLCELSLSKSVYPKYPAQPVVHCHGYGSKPEEHSNE